MLIVEHSSRFAPERKYVLRVLLGEILGLDFEVIPANRSNVVIRDADCSACIEMPDVLFSTEPENWLMPASLPVEPLQRVSVCELGVSTSRLEEPLPVIFGLCTEGVPIVTRSENATRLEIDILGSVFFCLTRYEEVVSPLRDRHSRFPAAAALAFREGFLHRPIVDEYAEILWELMSERFPRIKRRQRQPRLRMTFDIDWPAITLGLSVREVLHASGADIIRRKEPRLAARRLASLMHVRSGRVEKDAGNIFDWIMDACESRNLEATFFVISGGGRGDIDGSYVVEQPWIRHLLRSIHERGHQIGIHPTYESWRDPARTKAEFDRLRSVCASEGIVQSQWGGRQHYLRWEPQMTWQNYESAGIDFDSSLGYADDTGFRCGTCQEFPVFNLRTREELQLRERPLMAMDATLFGKPDKDGLDLTPQEAIQRLRSLQETCERYDGDLTLLWHNNWLIRRPVRMAFTEMLANQADPVTHEGVLA